MTNIIFTSIINKIFIRAPHYEANGYKHDLSLLIISHLLHVSCTMRSGCKEKVYESHTSTLASMLKHNSNGPPKCGWIVTRTEVHANTSNPLFIEYSGRVAYMDTHP